MSGTEQLISAIESKNLGKLSKLLEEMDLDQINGTQNEQTALHLACRAKYNEAVDLLVAKNGINVNVKNIGGDTPLHLAIRYDNAHAVTKILTNPQVNVNVQDNAGRTPLSAACLNGRHEIASRLLATPGVDTNVKDSFGQTPLSIACFYNSPWILSELLASPGVDVNVDGAFGITPILCAARECSAEALKLMLEDPRVDLDAKDKDEGGLEVQVERYGIDSNRKEKCLEMINNERRKRENSKADQEQASQGGMIGQRIERVEKLNKEMGDLEKKWKANLDSGKQKMRDLNERKSTEKKIVARKHKEAEAALKGRHKEEETTMNKRHKDEQTMLETTIAREDKVEQRHMAILKELRDELAKEIQKITIDPAQDTSGDRVKLEAIEKSLECPVCMDLMRPPTRIWMCRLSHIICEPCKDGLDKKKENRGKCPTCMTERVNLRALMAENFASTVFNE